MTHYDRKLTPWVINEGQFPKNGTLREKSDFVIRYAILAPSSHNTEPWQFRLHESQIDLLVDRSRWLKIADDDQQELHISLGCALENLLVAADHFGLGCKVALMPHVDDTSVAATVEFDETAESAPHRPEGLFEMIPVRHTNHGRYEDRMVPAEVRQQIQESCVEDGVFLHLTGDEQIRRKVDELVVRGDAVQFADPAFFETPRRLGALGHTADEEGHEMLRSQMDGSEKVREDARHLMLFEWARELLLEEEE